MYASDVNNSQKIFYYLLSKNGKLSEDDRDPEAKDLYRAYVDNSDVSELLKEQAEIANSRIEKFGTSIYLIPNVDNSFLGFTKTDLKKILCKSNATSQDYYLSQFIILTLLTEIYDGEGRNCKTREFIKFSELQSTVSKMLNKGAECEKKKREEAASDPDASYEGEVLDFEGMRDAYESLKSVDVGGNKSKTTKEGVINTICTFLMDQGLIHYSPEDERIHPTAKLDCLMEYRILNNANFSEVKNLLEEIDYE